MALGVGFALTAGLAAAVTPRRHEQTIGAARLDELIPDRVGSWQTAPGGAVVLPDSDQPLDVYDQVLTRSFLAPNLPGIMLLIAYGAAQSGLMKVHRPEVCYASSGFSISHDRPVGIPLEFTSPIAAKTFLGVREDRVEQVLYWTRISNVFPQDLTTQRLVILERGLSGVIPDGVLVRCSTPGSDLIAGQTAMQGFASALVADASPQGRALLIGLVKPTVHA
jgi:EpsI family protein